MRDPDKVQLSRLFKEYNLLLGQAEETKIEIIKLEKKMHGFSPTEDFEIAIRDLGNSSKRG